MGHESTKTETIQQNHFTHDLGELFSIFHHNNETIEKNINNI